MATHSRAYSSAAMGRIAADAAATSSLESTIPTLPNEVYNAFPTTCIAVEGNAAQEVQGNGEEEAELSQEVPLTPSMADAVSPAESSMAVVSVVDGELKEDVAMAVSVADKELEKDVAMTMSVVDGELKEDVAMAMSVVDGELKEDVAMAVNVADGELEEDVAMAVSVVDGELKEDVASVCDEVGVVASNQDGGKAAKKSFNIYELSF